MRSKVTGWPIFAWTFSGPSHFGFLYLRTSIFQPAELDSQPSSRRTRRFEKSTRSPASCGPAPSSAALSDRMVVRSFELALFGLESTYQRPSNLPMRSVPVAAVLIASASSTTVSSSQAPTSGLRGRASSIGAISR